MPETPSTIKQDIAELERKLQEKKAALEHETSEKDVLRGLIGEKIQEHVPQYSPVIGNQPASGLSTTRIPAPIATELPSYLNESLRDKIRELVKLVFDKNLEEGIKEANKIGNMAFMDAFHDILTDELYLKLIETRKIDKVQ